MAEAARRLLTAAPALPPQVTKVLMVVELGRLRVVVSVQVEVVVVVVACLECVSVVVVVFE